MASLLSEGKAIFLQGSLISSVLIFLVLFVGYVWEQVRLYWNTRQVEARWEQEQQQQQQQQLPAVPEVMAYLTPLSLALTAGCILHSALAQPQLQMLQHLTSRSVDWPCAFVVSTQVLAQHRKYSCDFDHCSALLCSFPKTSKRRFIDCCYPLSP